MENNVLENKRPTLITIFCVIGFIGALFNIFGAVSGLLFKSSVPVEIAIPTWYFIYGLIIGVLYLVVVELIWKMKKVGVVVYTILIVVGAIVGFVGGYTTIVDFILPIIIAVFFWTQYKKMS